MNVCACVRTDACIHARASVPVCLFECVLACVRPRMRVCVLRMEGQRGRNGHGGRENLLHFVF